MTGDISFQIDTSCDDTSRSSRLFYLSNGNIDDSFDDGSSKPSQERPAILKMKAKRYHEKGIEKKCTPGKISYQLRKAMGLGMSDIPEYIYRMRHLGYPTGWLKKAEVKKENLSITGEFAVVNTSASSSIKYDWEKLFAYPGFNTFKDYDRRYDRCDERGFMRMQENSLLENFLSYLSNKHMLGKEATDMADIRSRHVIDTSTDFNLPVAPGPKPVARSTPNQRNKSKQHLEESTANLSDGEMEDGEADVNMDNEEAKRAVPENGTMLLVPSAAKPDLDRFSEGINEHRLFENLPNSAGGYRKVLDVLKRIQA